MVSCQSNLALHRGSLKKAPKLHIQPLMYRNRTEDRLVVKLELNEEKGSFSTKVKEKQRYFHNYVLRTVHYHRNRLKSESKELLNNIRALVETRSMPRLAWSKDSSALARSIIPKQVSARQGRLACKCGMVDFE